MNHLDNAGQIYLEYNEIFTRPYLKIYSSVKKISVKKVSASKYGSQGTPQTVR